MNENPDSMKEYLIILKTGGTLELDLGSGQPHDFPVFEPFDVAGQKPLKLTDGTSACEIHRVMSAALPTEAPVARDLSTLCLSVDRDGSSILKAIRVHARPKSRKAGTDTISSSEPAVPPGGKKRKAKRNNPRWVSYSKGRIELDIKC